MDVSLGELAAAIGASLRGDAEIRVRRVATLQDAEPGDVSFLANRRYARQLAGTRASAVIVGPRDAAACHTACLVADDPYLAYAKAATLVSDAPVRRQGIHVDASVSDQAEVDAQAWIGPQSVVEAGARIAAGVQVGPGCFIGAGVRIGADCHLVANVTLCDGVRLGARVRIFPGAVIGADGFGFAKDGPGWFKIPQLGSVVIGDDVEIGANTTIDRGALQDTVIGNGVKLDNQIQIGHNVQIGDHTIMAGCSAVAGSAVLGSQCAFGGGVSILGHLHVADGTQVTATSVIFGSIDEPGVYSSGLPLDENGHWRRNHVRFKQLDAMAKRISSLERALEAIKSKT